MKKRTLWIVGIAVLLIVPSSMWLFAGQAEEGEIVAQVKRGLFEIRVQTTGELEAKNSVQVKGPQRLQTIGIWRVQISDMVDEGTIVSKGEFIASLDRSEISNKIKDVRNEVQQAESKYVQTRIDTTLDMRQARENLANLGFQAREAKITLEQSKYEPPATIRQAQIELEKAQKAFDEGIGNYDLKKQQAEAKMQEAAAELNQSKNKMTTLDEVYNEFNVIAPEDGMVIYVRDWNGRKQGVGSEINAWDPTVAKLPDLTSMISKTYVNEVDIRKIKTGQHVEISLDAFPDKSLRGQVITVANVGEQLKRSDAKVFEVVVEVLDKDTTLRPAMTTGNSIIAGSYEDVLFVPLEAIHSSGDTLNYVFAKKGFDITRKEVTVGLSNENFAIIEAGVEENESLLLSKPDEAERYDMQVLADQQD